MILKGGPFGKVAQCQGYIFLFVQIEKVPPVSFEQGAGGTFFMIALVFYRIKRASS